MAEAQRKNNQNANYAPEYPTISGDFNERQYNRSGIQNVQVEQSTANQNQTPRSSGRRAYTTTTRDNRARRARRRQLSSNAGGAETARRPRLLPNPLAKPDTTTKDTGAVATIASTTAVFNVAMATGWITLLNSVLVPFGIVTWAAIGGTMAIAAIPGGETIASWVAYWFFGIEENFNLWTLAMACLGIYWFGIITMFALAHLQFTFSGLKPTSGRAGGLKKASFAAALVLMAIPAVNIMPFILVWLFLVARFPR